MKDFKTKYLERKFMDNFDKKYPYADKMLPPRVPYEVGHDDAILDLFPYINEMRTLLESISSSHIKNIETEEYWKQFDKDELIHIILTDIKDSNKALKNLYEFVGGGE